MSSLHAHLVLVTKYRRREFTSDMPTFCAHTMRTVGTELDAELVDFNGDPENMHLLGYPPMLAIATLVRRVNGRTAYVVRRENIGTFVCARMCGHLWSPSCFAGCCAGAPPLILKPCIEGHTRPL